MTTLALAAPTVSLGGGNGGLLLPAAETAMAANAGFSFPNNGAVIVRIVVGSAGTGNLVFVIQGKLEGVAPIFAPITLANSSIYHFGPFSRADFNDVNGLVQATMTVPTGNSVGVYISPGTSGS